MRAGRPSPLRSPVRLRILSLRAREATSRQAPWSFQRAGPCAQGWLLGIVAASRAQRAPKGAQSAPYPTRCHHTLRASDLFALSESRGRAQVSTPQPRTQRARALPRSGSSQFMAPTPPAPFLLPILPGAGPCALILSPLPRVQEQREPPATSGPARGRPSGELACANKLYVVVFVAGVMSSVMISPSVVRVAALVPDPIQQIKDGGATYEMNELVFSPRYFNVVVTLPH